MFAAALGSLAFGAEAGTAAWPRLISVEGGEAVLRFSGKPAVRVRPGSRAGDFELVALLPGPTAVLERGFPGRSVTGYLSPSGPAALLPRAVGQFGAIPAARPGFEPAYYDRVMAAQEDLLGAPVLAAKEGPSWDAVAPLLPPLDSYTFLGTVTSPRKIVVQPDGRLGIGASRRHADLAEVLFDPWKQAPWPLPSRGAPGLRSMKGLAGSYLPVIDYAFYDPATGAGFEEIAFQAGDRGTLHVCLRSPSGKRLYWKDGGSASEDGAEFWAALLSVHREWERFFGAGAQIETPERLVTDASKASLVRALISYVGLHPKYGAIVYWDKAHDTFPPTTLLLNNVLLDWGFLNHARDRIGYYLDRHVKPDGMFDYYGPAVTEYGQMLALAVRYARLSGDDRWMEARLPALERIARRLLALREESRARPDASSPSYGLIRGAAEADTREDQAFYYSGDVWCARGFHELGAWMKDEGLRSRDASMAERGQQWADAAASYRADIVRSLERSRIGSASPPFVPPVAGMTRAFERMTEDNFASYTNYRYWLEMLSAEIVPPRMRDEIVAYRQARGGDLLGTTRFTRQMDDWPYAHYAWALLDAGRIRHYLLGFYGHLAHHLTPGTFMAYEQVAIRGEATRRHAADYCVPAQVVTPQMLRWMLVWEPWSEETLRLARAVPQRWFREGFSARDVRTRWGPVTLDVRPEGRGFRAVVAMPRPHPGMALELRLDSGRRLEAAGLKVEGVADWRWDPETQTLSASGPWTRIVAAAR